MSWKWDHNAKQSIGLKHDLGLFLEGFVRFSRAHLRLSVGVFVQVKCSHVNTRLSGEIRSLLWWCRLCNLLLQHSSVQPDFFPVHTHFSTSVLCHVYALLNHWLCSETPPCPASVRIRLLACMCVREQEVRERLGRWWTSADGIRNRVAAWLALPGLTEPQTSTEWVTKGRWISNTCRMFKEDFTSKNICPN